MTDRIHQIAADPNGTDALRSLVRSVAVELPRLIDDETSREIELGLAHHDIPAHCRDGLRDFFCHGIRPGAFLLAVLENNLYMACVRADDDNRRAIVHYAQFLVHHAPADAWGSPFAVRAWLERGQLARKVAELAAGR